MKAGESIRLLPHASSILFFTTKENGVGLGLSVAYKIMAQHGGTLTVRNDGRGAIFQLLLPMAFVNGSAERIHVPQADPITATAMFDIN